MSASKSQAPCPVCRQPLDLRIARGRKSGKTFLMLICAHDARHFRGFINDRAFVDGVLSRLENHKPGENARVGPETARTLPGAPKLIWSNLAKS